MSSLESVYAISAHGYFPCTRPYNHPSISTCFYMQLAQIKGMFTSVTFDATKFLKANHSFWTPKQKNSTKEAARYPQKAT